MYSTHLTKNLRNSLLLVLMLVLLTLFCLATNAKAAELPEMTELFTLEPKAGVFSGTVEGFSWSHTGASKGVLNGTFGNYTGDVHKLGHSSILMTDTTGTLADHEVVALSFDLFFEKFPEPKASGEFFTQSLVAWFGTSYDGLRIDSDGKLYSDNSTNAYLDVKLKLNTWYSISVIYSQSVNKVELWINGELVATAPCLPRNAANTLRLFDSANTPFVAYVKNLRASCSDTFYYSGLNKEASADFISYQTTEPDADGKFNVRVLAGIPSTDYKKYGCKVIRLTKDAEGNITETVSDGTSSKVYSSVFGGSTEYPISDFGFPFAGIATVMGIDTKLAFTELVILPYTIDNAGTKLYGTPISLSYTNEMDKDGFPILHNTKKTYDLAATGDTTIDCSNPDDTNGINSQLLVRNAGGYTTGDYRAAYFKFKVPAEAVQEMSYMTKITLKVAVRGIDTSKAERTKQPLKVYGIDQTDWTEDDLTYKTTSADARVEITGSNLISDYVAGSYLIFDVTSYVKECTQGKTGEVDIAFSVTHADNSNDPAVVYLYSKEAAGHEPSLHFDQTLYGHSISNTKTMNMGYEPLSYAETLVNEWFDDLKDKIYQKDENGNLVYHTELGTFAPDGYGLTEAAGDFSAETPWIGGSAWTTTKNTDGNYIVDESEWKTDKFARTLSTLGSTKATSYLASGYATSTYDIYGGISNAGFTGKIGFFHTETIGSRVWVIDPLGNPYFAVSVNQLNLGDTENQKGYSLAKYGTKEEYFADITTSMKESGINTAFVSDDNALLAVENGLNVAIGVSGIGSYMARLGRTQVKEGVYPANNTLNMFDPDFVKLINSRNYELIKTNGYDTNKRVFGYTSDNELPEGNNILERYLTLDPNIYENIFSYHTAWTWLGRRMDTLNPTLDDYLNSSEKSEINSEFLSFLYSHYYKSVRKSIEAADKNHMYLGSRAFQTCKTDEGYLRAAGYHLDAITLNLYDGLNPPKETISNIYKYSGKPFIVTEFFAKAQDAIDANGYKLANSTGAGILVKTQQDRANYYESYVLNLLESKACVGWSWYRFRDNDQSLYTATKDDETLTDLRMLYVYYSDISWPNTLMDSNGNVYTNTELGITQSNWESVLEKTYSGEGLASNQNVNKGIFNGDFSTTVTIVDDTSDYDFGSKTWEVIAVVNNETSARKESGFEESDFTSEVTLTLKKPGYDLANDTSDMTITHPFDSNTHLTTLNGQYLTLSASIKKISDNIMGIINYLDSNQHIRAVSPAE